jgi:hypothetical protein
MSRTKTGSEANQLKCSFCGKGQKSIKKLIAGPGVYICDECVDLCVRIIEEESADDEEPSKLDHPDVDTDEALRRMVSLHESREQVDREVAAAVRGLRAKGVTWTRIGEALGISKQSAWERYSGEE